MFRMRMTVHEALDHPWLKGDLGALDKRIPNERYHDFRNKIRDKYVSALSCKRYPYNFRF